MGGIMIEGRNDFYTSQKSKLLKDFDKTIKRVGPVFIDHYGEKLTDNLVKEVRQEYELLIPQLPYIGGKQPFTQFLIASAWYLALYRVLKAHGKTVEETGELIFIITKKYLDSMPWFLRRFFGRMNFSKRSIQKIQKKARESQERRYPGDYVFNFVEGVNGDFDYGVDYIECAVYKFLEEQDASELAPYICPADILYSEALGWGLKRTKTLAEGCEKCDFRFKKGGETRVAVPENLKKLLK
jgi:hypothetical protein